MTRSQETRSQRCLEAALRAGGKKVRPADLSTVSTGRREMREKERVRFQCSERNRNRR